MLSKIRIGVSACLLGHTVRYDGAHKRDPLLIDTLSPSFSLFCLCPEVGIGLPVPREPMHLVGSPAAPRLLTVRTKVDLTPKMRTFSNRILPQLESEKISGFILKSSSPSCGLHGVKLYRPRSHSRHSHVAVGLFARALTRRFPLLPVEDDLRLHNPALLGYFIDRVSIYHAWLSIPSTRTTDQLLNFHARHRSLVELRSPKSVTRLDALLGGALLNPPRSTTRLYTSYLRLFFSLIAPNPQSRH